MPLAITQAAAYINTGEGERSIKQYLAGLCAKNGSMPDVLLNAEPDFWRDREANNCLGQTWWTSFEQIENIRPSAMDLLGLMSLCDRQAIPRNLLQAPWEDQSNAKAKRIDEEGALSNSHERKGNIADDGYTPGNEATSVSDEITFIKDVTILKKFALISQITSSERSDLRMHQLVQYAVRSWLQAKDRLSSIEATFIGKLDIILPAVKHDTLETILPLFPHLEATRQLRPRRRGTVMLQWASIMYKGSQYLRKMWKPEDSERLALDCLEARKETLDADCDDVAAAVANLASTYYCQYRYEEAEKLQMQMLDTQQKRLGGDHLDTLDSMQELAKTLRMQRRHEEAEDLQQQVLGARRSKLDHDHLNTLDSKQNFATTPDSIQDFPKRLNSTQDLAITDKILESMQELAITYLVDRRQKEAEGLQTQVLGIRRIQLGRRHPDTLDSEGRLALVYLDQGRHHEAEVLQEHLLASRQKTLGHDHLTTLVAMETLARIYCAQERLEEAESQQAQVVSLRQTKLGDVHLDTMTSMEILAQIYRGQTRFEEAEELQRQVIGARKMKLGDDHSDTLYGMQVLVSILFSQNRFKEIEELSMQIIGTQRTKLGVDHADTLVAMWNLALTYKRQGRLKEAEALQVSVVEKLQTKYGREATDVLEATRLLKDIRLAQQRVDRSTKDSRSTPKNEGKEHPEDSSHSKKKWWQKPRTNQS